jgi:hypothetical protein
VTALLSNVKVILLLHQSGLTVISQCDSLFMSGSSTIFPSFNNFSAFEYVACLESPMLKPYASPLVISLVPKKYDMAPVISPQTIKIPHKNNIILLSLPLFIINTSLYQSSCRNYLL